MKTILAFAVATSLLSVSPAFAQQLELPRPSPGVKTTARVGLTDITIDYSSPGVKGRKIWGGLLPYDKLWRTGANAATKITFSKDVIVGDKPAPAGTYSVFTIPGKAVWTVILNKDADASTGSYKQEQDLLRLQVKPARIPPRERLTFTFANTTDDGTSLDLEWEKLRVSLPIKVGTADQAMANIKSAVESGWRPYNAAARYLLDQKKDYDTAMKYADQSIAIQEEWFNVWTKAQLLAAKGQKKDALVQAKRAEELGNKNPQGFFLGDEVKKAVKDWAK